MKNKKIKLTNLKVNSFVTNESAAIKGGAPLYTGGHNCKYPVHTEDNCQPSDVNLCEASFERHCPWSVGGLYCG